MYDEDSNGIVSTMACIQTAVVAGSTHMSYKYKSMLYEMYMRGGGCMARYVTYVDIVMIYDREREYKRT